LEAAAKRMPSEISGGMKKRVGIARAIVMNPMYLFCDEPNSGLDPLTSVKIDELIKEITEEYQITTIIITHDMNSVMEIGQNIMFLYQGSKLWEGVNSEITKTVVPELKEFFFSNKLLAKCSPNCSLIFCSKREYSFSLSKTHSLKRLLIRPCGPVQKSTDH
jgi:phospholipid/cholesterol/gamma-HCH transport system ATP-binding protein